MTPTSPIIKSARSPDTDSVTTFSGSDFGSEPATPNTPRKPVDSNRHKSKKEMADSDPLTVLFKEGRAPQPSRPGLGIGIREMFLARLSPPYWRRTAEDLSDLDWLDSFDFEENEHTARLFNFARLSEKPPGVGIVEFTKEFISYFGRPRSVVDIHDLPRDGTPTFFNYIECRRFELAHYGNTNDPGVAQDVKHQLIQQMMDALGPGPNDGGTRLFHGTSPFHAYRLITEGITDTNWQLPWRQTFGSGISCFEEIGDAYNIARFHRAFAPYTVGIIFVIDLPDNYDDGLNTLRILPDQQDLWFRIVEGINYLYLSGVSDAWAAQLIDAEDPGQFDLIEGRAWGPESTDRAVMTNMQVSTFRNWRSWSRLGFKNNRARIKAFFFRFDPDNGPAPVSPERPQR